MKSRVFVKRQKRVDQRCYGSAGPFARVNRTSVEARDEDGGRRQKSHRIGIKVSLRALCGACSLAARAGARERSDEEYPAHPHGHRTSGQAWGCGVSGGPRLVVWGPGPNREASDRAWGWGVGGGPRFVVWGPGPKREASDPAWGCGGSGCAPPMPAVGEVPGRNGAGAKRRRSEAHAEPGELTRVTDTNRAV